MKKQNTFLKIQVFILSLFGSIIIFAQEKAADLKVDVNINKDSNMGGDWMSNPLVWIIGALLLILIIALIARGGGNKS